MIKNSFDGWNENPIIISVDSLENPLKDIEFPALTLCPDFEPDHTILVEELFNSFEFNCPLDDNTCDTIRKDFDDALEAVYNYVQFRANNLEFEYGFTMTKDGQSPTLESKFYFSSGNPALTFERPFLLIGQGL